MSSDRFFLSDEVLIGAIGRPNTPTLEGIEQFIPEVSDAASPEQELARLKKLSYLLKRYDQVNKEGGINKWFVPNTPFGIEHCPKHAAFFKAGATYNERVFMAGNRCHIAGTRVWMADGSEKNIEDCAIGDEVLAYDLASRSLVPTRVVDTFAGIADNLRTYYSPTSKREIGCTLDHPFLTISARGKLAQRTAEKMKYWHKVVIPSKWNIEGTHPGFSENVSKLLGLLVGDGYLAAKDDQFKLTNCNEEVLAFAEAVATEELDSSPRRVQQRGYTDLFFPKTSGTKGTTKLGKLLKETGLYGTRSGNKFVPACILLAPEGHVRAFIQGLLAADGHYKSGVISLYTTSKLLASTYEKACLRLGVYSTWHTKVHKNTNHADCFTVNICGDSNLRKIGSSIYKTPIFRGAERQKENMRAVSLRKGDLLPKQEIYCITVEHPDHLFVANGYVNSNTGKSISGAFEASCHATGIYPAWWVGRRFDKPTYGWAVGSTARSTRDTAQKELLGPIGAWGTGMIPKESIGKFWALAGVPQGVDLIKVKHQPTDGWSMISFKNYEQPVEAFYGTSLDWIWADEESPQDRYNEMLLRTMTTDGIVFNTFTPLKGLTPMVVRFSEKADYLAGAEKLIGIPDKDDHEEKDARLENVTTAKAIIQAGWDDAPWLTEKSKEQMEADTEPHLRAARRSGRPSMGSGNVFPISLEEIMIEPFKIPGYYKRLYALDVGWNRTAVLWAALDPQTSILYLYDEHYVGEQQPPLHAAAIRSRGEWIPGVIDPASRGRGQADGRQLMKDYKDLGLRLSPAINARDSGISELWQRMSTGNLKIFNSLTSLAKEFVLYRRKLNGKIVDENDHLMDCMRYIQNNLSRARSLDQLSSSARYDGVIRYNI